MPVRLLGLLGALDSASVRQLQSEYKAKYAGCTTGEAFMTAGPKFLGKLRDTKKSKRYFEWDERTTAQEETKLSKERKGVPKGIKLVDGAVVVMDEDDMEQQSRGASGYQPPLPRWGGSFEVNV